MPGPAVYVVAVVATVVAGVAFHQFVYEPHIAPKLEAWAESYLERRGRRRQGTRPVLAPPVDGRSGGDGSSGSGDGPRDNARAQVSSGRSIELEPLPGRTTDDRRRSLNASGLRQRRTAGAMSESDRLPPHIDTTPPTHVLFDTSVPPSPSALSGGTLSMESSPAHPALGLTLPRSYALDPSPAFPQVMSPQLPTPVSDSIASPHISERSPISSHHTSPNLGMSQSLALSSYTTPLNSLLVDPDTPPTPPTRSRVASPSPRVMSPFSDVHAASPRSPSLRGAAARAQSPGSMSTASELTFASDEDFEALEPRWGTFSPPARAEDDPFEVASEASWASVGRRSPTDF